MNINSITFKLAYLSFICFCFTCNRELKIDDSDKQYAIQLRRDTSNEPTRFNWDKINISSFKEYILVRSDKPIPDGQLPKIGSNDFTVVTEITDADSIQYQDYNAPISTGLHYKLYIDIGNRFIESPDIMDYQDYFIFDNSYDKFYMDKDSSWVYLFNSAKKKITVFDYRQNNIISETIISDYINTFTAVTSGYEGQTKYLYVNNTYGNNYKFELPSLNLIKSIVFKYQNYSLCSNNNGLLISTNNDQVLSTNIWKLPEFTKLKSISLSNFADYRVLCLLDPATNKVLEVSPAQMTSYNVNQQTGSISNSNTVTLIKSDKILSQIVTSRDGQYFIPNSRLKVYDRDLNVVKDANSINFNDYCFSDNLNFIYLLTTGTGEVVQYSFPDLKKVRQIAIPFFSINRINTYNNTVVLFGTNQLTDQFVFKKIIFK